MSTTKQAVIRFGPPLPGWIVATASSIIPPPAAGRVFVMPFRLSIIILPAFGLLAAGLVGAQSAGPGSAHEPKPSAAAKALQNPIEPTEQSLAEGKRVFIAQCALCHGESGAGDPAMQGQLAAPIPNLTDDEWVYGSTDGEIFTLIQTGTPNDMQGFGDKLRDRQIWSIVNYIRSLDPAESDESTPLQNPVPKTTESLMAGRQNYARFCVECHGLDGRGHTEMNEFLLTRPADLTKDDWTYGTDDGVVFGIIKNGTPNDMPAFADRFDDEAIWNIVNYLESLRN